MSVRKKYPPHAIHETKVHQTIKDMIDDDEIICPNCRGHGTVIVTGVRPNINENKEITCPVCGGSGTL